MLNERNFQNRRLVRPMRIKGHFQFQKQFQLSRRMIKGIITHSNHGAEEFIGLSASEDDRVKVPRVYTGEEEVDSFMRIWQRWQSSLKF